jgi:hypothetical protein
MLDFMIVYESDYRTFMDLPDSKAPLPCPEQICDKPVLNTAQILSLTNDFDTLLKLCLNVNANLFYCRPSITLPCA